MLKETELWFKSLRREDQPRSNQKRKCWSLSRSLPELACDPADTARARQHSQESRLRRRTVQVQRHLEALVEQSRRQTALLLRKQQRAFSVQRFLRQPITAPPCSHGNKDHESSTCGRADCGGSLADRYGCCSISDERRVERSAWWQSDPDLCREPCCSATPCRLSCCGPRTPQHGGQHNCSPPQQGGTPNPSPPQQMAPQSNCPSQQTAPQSHGPSQQMTPKSNCPSQHTSVQRQSLPQQTVTQNQCHPQRTASQTSCPRLETSSKDDYPPGHETLQNQCQLQQTTSLNYSQPSSQQQDKKVRRRPARVTFGPAVIQTPDTDRAEYKLPSETARDSSAWKGSDGSTRARPTGVQNSSKSAEGLKSTDSTAEASVTGASTAKGDPEPRTEDKPATGSRTCEDKRDISLERDPAPGEAYFQETPCPGKPPSPSPRMSPDPGRTEACPDWQKQEGFTSDRSTEPHHPYVSQADELTVVGRQCQLSPRGSAQNKPVTVSEKTVVIVEDKLASGTTDAGYHNTQQPSSQSAELRGISSESKGAKSRSLFQQENPRTPIESISSQGIVTQRKEHEAHKSPKMNDTLRCSEVGTDTASSKEKTNGAATASTSSSHGETSRVNPQAISKNHQVESLRVASPSPEHAIQQTKPGIARTPSLNDSEEDQRAFFIDIATGESCTIQSLSAESAGFRGNRTLLLRQLLSQQKIDDAESKNKIYSPRPTRRRAASQGRVRNAEMMVDTLLHQATREGRYHLPILPGTGAGPTPLVLHGQPLAYFDVKNSLKSVRSHGHRGDLHHQDGFTQMRLRHRSADARHRIEHPAESRSHGTASSSLAAILGADQRFNTRTKQRHTSSIEDSRHCCSGHHRCVHAPRDNPPHICSDENGEHADFTPTMLHGWGPSPPVSSQRNDRPRPASHGNTFHPVPEPDTGSLTAVTDTRSAQQTLVSSACVSELVQGQDTSSEQRVPAKPKQEDSLSRIYQSVVKEPESSPIHRKESHPHVQVSQSDPNPDILPASELTGLTLSATTRSLQDEGSHYPANASGTESQQGRPTWPAVSPTTSITLPQGTADPARIPAQWLEGTALQQRVSARAMTLLTTDSHPSPAVQTRDAHQTAAKSDIGLPAAAGVTKRPDWREDPAELRNIDNRSREAQVSLGGRAQRAPPTSTVAAEVKNWTSVTLVSPQNMEMSFSLSTHLPSISDQRPQQRQRQRASEEAKMNSGAVPKQPR